MSFTVNEKLRTHTQTLKIGSATPHLPRTSPAYATAAHIIDQTSHMKFIDYLHSCLK